MGRCRRTEPARAARDSGLLEPRILFPYSFRAADRRYREDFNQPRALHGKREAGESYRSPREIRDRSRSRDSPEGERRGMAASPAGSGHAAHYRFEPPGQAADWGQTGRGEAEKEESPRISGARHGHFRDFAVHHPG